MLIILWVHDFVREKYSFKVFDKVSKFLYRIYIRFLLLVTKTCLVCFAWIEETSIMCYLFTKLFMTWIYCYMDKELTLYVYSEHTRARLSLASCEMSYIYICMTCILIIHVCAFDNILRNWHYRKQTCTTVTYIYNVQFIKLVFDYDHVKLN